MSVEVVVPFAGTCRYRERAWEWVRRRYAAQHPDWKLTLAPGGDPWVKAEAVNPAVKASDAEVVIVADADVWTDGLRRAVMALVCGEASWAVPHWNVHRLDEDSTEAVLTGADWQGLALKEKTYQGCWGGGVVVATRQTLLDVPLDSRFVGWGQEDASWGVALLTLYGRPWRGEADLIHLYHPPAERLTRVWGSLESRRLRRRYQQARKKPDAMRQLIGEE